MANKHGGSLLAHRASDERLRELRAWARPRVGSLSGAEVIVGAVDELLELREHFRSGTNPEIQRLTKCYDDLREEWLQLLGLLQRYQPDGSPPPGGGLAIAQWILESLDRRALPTDAPR